MNRFKYFSLKFYLRISLSFVLIVLKFQSEISAQPTAEFEKTISGTPFNCDTLGYLFQGIPTGIYSVNLATGIDSLLHANLIAFPPNQQLNAFGFNRTDNYIWGYRLHTNELVRIASNYSITLFPISGLPEHPGYNVGDIDENGIMYLTGTNQPIVYRVDVNPNSANYLHLLSSLSIDSSYIFDWSVSPVDGNLYAIDSSDNEIYRFNKTTGVRTLVGIATGDGIDTVGRFGASYMDAAGNFYVSANSGGKIFKISNPDNGNTIAVLFSNGPVSGNNDGAFCAGVLVNTVGSLKSNGNKLVNIFPSPFCNEMKVQANYNEPAEIILYNVLSQKIIQQTFIQSISINTEQLCSGMYFYEVRNKSSVIAKGKVMKD